MRIIVNRKGTRSIVECNTFGNECAELSHDEAMQILRNLQIENNEAESFASVGAFPAFLHTNVRDSMPNPIEIDKKWYFVWRIQNEIIFARTGRSPRSKDKLRPEKLKWSYFRESKKKFRGKRFNSVSNGELLKIVLQSPELLEALKDPRPTNRIGMNRALHQPRISASK